MYLCIWTSRLMSWSLSRIDGISLFDIETIYWWSLNDTNVKSVNLSKCQTSSKSKLIQLYIADWLKLSNNQINSSQRVKYLWPFIHYSLHAVVFSLAWQSEERVFVICFSFNSLHPVWGVDSFQDPRGSNAFPLCLLLLWKVPMHQFSP